MKRLFLAAALLSAPPLLACDVCGLFLGIQPKDRSTTVGLFYRFRQLDGMLGTAGVLKHGGHSATTTADQHYTELYQVLELRGDVWFGPRFAVMASVPLVNNYQGVDGYARADLYGVGDPFVLARYVLANTRGLSDVPRTVHRFTVGLGGKVPLGATDRTWAGQEVGHDLQPGTGSWDGLASAEYLVRRQRWGGSLAVTGRLNSVGAGDHRMGHGLSATAEGFHQVPIGAFTLAPSLGLYAEHAGMDRQNDGKVPGTGANTLFTHVGSRVWWRNWMVTVNHQYAVARSSGEWMIPNRQRAILGITYAFN
ncbi:MAG TPA: hypothetical protein PLH93_06850 [Flavobacteriales bacterium]|nr:hypothetical protein [Flavobacteriales bacterium]HQW86884.1 hypothetical protein [Flavobacteriales bacterium]